MVIKAASVSAGENLTCEFNGSPWGLRIQWDFLEPLDVAPDVVFPSTQLQRTHVVTITSPQEKSSESVYVDKLLDFRHTFSSTNFGYVSTLVILDVLRKRGTFVCTVSNQLGSAATALHLVVDNAPWV